jgi:hypothetical protein
MEISTAKSKVHALVIKSEEDWQVGFESYEVLARA